MVDASLRDLGAGAPRILMFGLNNEMTAVVLRTFLSQGLRSLGLVLPVSAAPHLLANNECLNIVDPPNSAHQLLKPAAGDHITQQAWDAGLPVWVVRDLGAAGTVQALAGLSADAGVVACFSRHIPRVAREQFAAGVLNIHPSLLPDYRGPAPLFWQFRAGESRLGVTIHLMDEGFDTGNIVAQKEVAVDGGISGSRATQIMAQAGAELILEALQGIRNGEFTSYAQPSGGSSFGWPTDEDFSIETTWTARRAFDFMRSTAGWGRPYLLDMTGQALVLVEALAISDRRMVDPIEWLEQDIVWIAMSNGALRARLG